MRVRTDREGLGVSVQSPGGMESDYPAISAGEDPSLVSEVNLGSPEHHPYSHA